MDFNDLLDMQRKYEFNVHTKAKKSRIDTNLERRLALKVELSELANESGRFKYWKQNHKINKDKLLDEAADVLHFILSLTIDLGPVGERIIQKLNNFDGFYMKTIVESFLEAFECYDVRLIVNYFITICIGLEISKEELIDAYIKKNKINYERLESGY